MDAQLLDKLFEEQLKRDDKCEIDFCADLDNYSISDDFVVKYKRSLTDKVAKVLLTHPLIDKFDITTHITNLDSRESWVKPVNRQVASDCARLADFFIHLSTKARPDLQRSEYVIAPNAVMRSREYNALFSRAVTTLDSTDRYILTYITIATLECNDCEVLQN